MSLSDKIMNVNLETSNNTPCNFNVIEDNDVKEFIKRLKEQVLRKGRRALPYIDKLAGDKLVESETK